MFRTAKKMDGRISALEQDVRFLRGSLQESVERLNREIGEGADAHETQQVKSLRRVANELSDHAEAVSRVVAQLVEQEDRVSVLELALRRLANRVEMDAEEGTKRAAALLERMDAAWPEARKTPL